MSKISICVDCSGEIGITCANNEQGFVVITELLHGGQAMRAGAKVEDRVLAVNGNLVNTHVEAIEQINNAKCYFEIHVMRTMPFDHLWQFILHCGWVLVAVITLLVPALVRAQQHCNTQQPSTSMPQHLNRVHEISCPSIRRVLSEPSRAQRFSLWNDSNCTSGCSFQAPCLAVNSSTSRPSKYPCCVLRAPRKLNRAAQVVGLILESRPHAAVKTVIMKVSTDASVDVLWFHALEHIEWVMDTVQAMRPLLRHAVRPVLALPTNLSYCNANKLPLLRQFWLRVQREVPKRTTHVLMFEVDSATCGLAAGTVAFTAALQFDYCGATWPHRPKGLSVGNSGFSIWHIATALEVCTARRQEMKARELVSSGVQYLSHARAALKSAGIRRVVTKLDSASLLAADVFEAGELHTGPCWQTDVVFSSWCSGQPGFGDEVTPPLPYPTCSICPENVSVRFSVEHEKNFANGTFAFHKPWRSHLKDDNDHPCVKFSHTVRRLQYLVGSDVTKRSNRMMRQRKRMRPIELRI